MGEQVDARCLPSATTTWLTPRWILDALGDFDLDPCCPPVMPWRTARMMWSNTPTDPAPGFSTILQDGIAYEWRGRVWLNPPYGRKEIVPWLEKLAGHGSGIALVFARTDTRWFQEYVFGAAHSILFLKRRVRFCRPDGTRRGSPAAPSVLAAYGMHNSEQLRACGLEGKWLET